MGTTVSAEPATRLHVRGLRKSYPSATGPLTILDGIDLDLVGGDEVAITGPSGAGKSTLLHILGGLDSASEGTVDLDGRRIAQLSSAELADYRNRSVGFVFQDHHLLPQCTVLENVLIPCLAAGGATGERIERAKGLLHRVGMSHRIGHRPSELSGGEKQRVAFARAMINQPRLLLCDEPTGNLDRNTADKVAEALLSLARESEAILIVVTHSADLADKLRLRLELVDGRLAPA